MIELSGDSNAVHRSDSAARRAGFDRRIAHGMLVGGLIHQALGEQGWFAHAAIERQEWRFVAPVYFEADCRLRVDLEIRRVTLDREEVHLDLRAAVERCTQGGRWEEVIVSDLDLRVAPSALDNPRAAFSPRPGELFV
jgi:acyl dehydratase